MQESAKQRNCNKKINTNKTPAINLGKVEESNTKAITRYYLNYQKTATFAKRRKLCAETGKYQPTHYALNGVQIMDAIDRAFKSAIMNMFKLLKKTMSKELKKNMTMVSYQVESNNREVA